MKLPKSSKSAQRRTAWKARRDSRVRVDVETRPAFGLDFATAAGADRSVVHAYAFDAAASLPEGARLVDSHGVEYEVAGPPEPAQLASQPEAARVPLRRVEERPAAPARRVLHRSMKWSPLLGLAMAATVAGAADGLRVESAPRKKEEE